MQRVLVPLLLLISASSLSSQEAPGTESERSELGIPGVSHPVADTSLETALRRITSDFRGHAAIYARRLGTGQEIAIDADEILPTASMIQIPLLVGLYAAIEQGRFQLTDELPYDEALRRPGSGDVLDKLREGETVSLWRLAGLMIGIADHGASRWIQDLVGGAEVNDWLDAHGFDHTRINSRVDGREEAYQTYGLGQSTPREMSRLMVALLDGEVVSESASREMYRLLSRNWWPFGAKSALPPTVNVAAKAGANSTAGSEILMVNAPAGDYVLCIMAGRDANGVFEGGDALIRAVSALVWEEWSGPG